MPEDDDRTISERMLSSERTHKADELRLVDFCAYGAH